ncbi:MAG: glycosyltransferase [Candidatus Nanohaloarchaea archaeon]|nr:glycosyltransferase [Candidatus Nanohaloarchaea archaeon]
MPGKILMLSHTYPLDGDSGVTPFVGHIGEQMEREGFDVHVLLPEHPGLEEWGEATLHTFTYSGQRSLEYKDVSDDRADISPVEVAKYVLNCYRRAAALHNVHGFDLVHAHWAVPSGIPAATLKLLHGTPLVVHTHGRDVYNIPEIGYDVPADPRARTVIRSVIRLADHVVANSHSCRRYARRLGAGGWKSSVIPYGVDLDEFSPGRSDAALRDTLADRDDTLLLYVGDLIYRKGVQTLIEAVKEVDAVSLAVVGDGPYREELERMAGGDPSITFCGWKPHGDIPRFMATADVFVMPSLIEAFGIVNIEALATGTPVIGAETGGIPDIIDEDVGRTFEPGNVDQLQARIEELSGSEELQEELGRNGRERAEERYNWDVFGQELEEIYRST